MITSLPWHLCYILIIKRIGGDALDTYIFYGLAALGLSVSFFKDREKTRLALKKAWKSFENILPQFLVVLLAVGVLLTVLNPEVISKLIGAESGWYGTVIAAFIGAVTLIPGFVAFPTAAMLLQAGAGLMQIGAFISSLMMVGVVTMPIEIKYFGKKLTILRNLLAFAFSFVVALILTGWWVTMKRHETLRGFSHCPRRSHHPVAVLPRNWPEGP
jgi:uncharacterized membrane protein YraQ (UPF0718 family)